MVTESPPAVEPVLGLTEERLKLAPWLGCDGVVLAPPLLLGVTAGAVVVPPLLGVVPLDEGVVVWLGAVPVVVGAVPVVLGVVPPEPVGAGLGVVPLDEGVVDGATCTGVGGAVVGVVGATVEVGAGAGWAVVFGPGVGTAVVGAVDGVTGELVGAGVPVVPVAGGVVPVVPVAGGVLPVVVLVAGAGLVDPEGAGAVLPWLGAVLLAGDVLAVPEALKNTPCVLYACPVGLSAGTSEATMA